LGSEFGPACVAMARGIMTIDEISRVMTAAEDRMVVRCWRSQLFLLLCTPLLLTFDIFRLLRGLFHHVANKELFCDRPSGFRVTCLCPSLHSISLTGRNE
jgi:hypothetical protein